MQFLKHLQRFSFYIFLFSINFEMWNPIGSGETSIAKMTALIYFLSIVPQFPQFIRTDCLGSILLPIWIFFGLLTTMSLININPLFTEFFNRTIFLNIILFWILINHERKDYMIIEKGLISYAFGSFVLSLLFFAGIGITYTQGRLSMFGDNQNALGLKMVVSSIIILTTVIQNRLNLGWYRYLFLFAIPLMLIFIGETGSRVSALAFLLAFVTAVILFKTKNNLNKIISIISGSIILILMGFLLIQSGKLLDRLKDTSSTGDLGERDIIWRTITPIITKNPIVGVGETGYDFLTTEFFGNVISPHNVILEVLCYTGLIGLFLYLTFIIRVFMRGYKSYKSNDWLLPLLLMAPIMGSLLSGQILDDKTGWVIFAYIISTSAIKYQSRPQLNSFA